jgi:hypothetical protein
VLCALQWLVDLEGKTAAKIPSAHEEGSRLYFGNLAGAGRGNYMVTGPKCHKPLAFGSSVDVRGVVHCRAYRGALAEQA